MVAIGLLMRAFPPDLVDHVVDMTGVRERRQRALPSWLIVYLLLAMVLFAPAGYREVWDRLVSGLRWMGSPRAPASLGARPSAAAITYARQRVGWNVMEALLDAVTAGEAASQATSSIRLMAIDAIWVSMPATRWNIAEFGNPSTDAGPRTLLRTQATVIGDCETGSVLGAVISPAATAAPPGAELLGRVTQRRHDEGGILLLTSQELLGNDLLGEMLRAGVRGLWRTTADADLAIERELADGTYISRIAAPGEAGTASYGQPDPGHEAGIPVRVIEHWAAAASGVPRHEPLVLITDIVDPDTLPAALAVSAYARRSELGARLARLGTARPGAGGLALRSESPSMIRQEIYAMLCCYHAVLPLAGDGVNLTPSSHYIWRQLATSFSGPARRAHAFGKQAKNIGINLPRPQHR